VVDVRDNRYVSDSYKEKSREAYVRSIPENPLFQLRIDGLGKIRERLRAVDGFRATIKPACPERRIGRLSARQYLRVIGGLVA